MRRKTTISPILASIRSNQNGRSLNSEAIICLESVPVRNKISPAERLARARELRSGLQKKAFRTNDLDKLGYLRRKSISSAQAIKIQEEAESLMLGTEYEIESEGVLALARDSACSAYHCEFVASAMPLNTTLVWLPSRLACIAQLRTAVAV